MKLDPGPSVEWVARFTGARLTGNTDLTVTGLNEIHKVTPGDLTFVDSEKYYGRSLNSAATTIIINKEVECPPGKALLVHPDPFTAYVSLVKHFRPFTPASGMISESAEIGEGTHLQPNVFVGNRVKIGRNCLIHPNVVIYDDSIIGDNVIIHAGTVIGNDAYYYKTRKDRPLHYDKLESCGRAIIENDVEIGACCTISRGVSGDTIIGAGTKLDNQIHVGHGAVIGRNCLFAAQVGIGGKTIIEDEVIAWGQVGIAKDLRVGKGAMLNSQAGIINSIEGGKLYWGTPAIEAKTKNRELVWVKRIPEIWDRLQQLERGTSEK